MTKPSKSKQSWEKELYEVMDNFLVEAKDQYGNERSLEQLNQDRHLFMERAKKIVLESHKQLIDEVVKGVSINQKGQFEDDAGYVCWYLDDLITLLNSYKQK